MSADRKPRKKYKSLYLAEQSRHKTTQDRLAGARRRLLELNEALSPHGRKTLEAINGGEGPIEFLPLEFVAARAFIDSNARITSANDVYEIPTMYAWRDRPIYRIKPNRGE